jgi:DNA-binding MarR family transcriptional regulator
VDTAPRIPERLRLGYAVAKLARLVARNHAAQLDESVGLALAEWRLLLVLSTNRKTRFDIAAETSLVEKSQASLAARVLARKRLIKRTLDPADGRRIWLERTAAGDRVVQSYLAETSAANRELWGSLTPTQQRAMLKWLETLLVAAEAQSGQGLKRKRVRARG